MINEAGKWRGYSQIEVADFSGLHYSTISRLIKAVGETSKK
jgi:hypothetical protein